MFAEAMHSIRVKARLLVTEVHYESPFSIGIRHPLVVFPKHIIEGLSDDEKRAVIEHELFHVRHKDTFFQWVPVIIKDLLLFSPFSHLVFARLHQEQEKRIDRDVARFEGSGLSLAEALVMNARLMSGAVERLPMAKSLLGSRLFQKASMLKERVRALVEYSRGHTSGESQLRWIAAIVVAVVLLYVQVFIHLQFPSYVIQVL
jgi:beta-lactamase regulating signal transducer with metallopeptidase domain